MPKLTTRQLIQNANRKIDNQLVSAYEARGIATHRAKGNLHFGIRAYSGNSPVIFIGKRVYTPVNKDLEVRDGGNRGIVIRQKRT